MTRPLPFVFLDIDGVLNNSKSLPRLQDEHRTLWVMDRANVACLNALVERTGTRIVISSSWRHGLCPQEVRDVLTQFGGASAASRVVDATPRRLKVEGREGRAWEILEWLQGTYHEAYVALDDDLLLPGGPRPPRPPRQLRPILRRLVQTSARTGLTPADVERAVVVLEQENARETVQRLGVSQDKMSRFCR